ncbi:MAG: S41 family peptidase [Bacteroidota bacterium]
MRFLHLVVLIFTALLLGCEKTYDSYDLTTTESCGITVQYDGSSIRFCSKDASDSTIQLLRSQDEFIWQAMNLYYFYQSEINVLSDNRFSDYESLYDYLNSFGSSEELFYESLLSTADRFSWIVDDYVALENSLQGITTSFGYNFRLLRESEGSDDLFGYVEYVVEGGPADNAGLIRGDIFNKVNGNQLTSDNYNSLLFKTNSYELTLAALQDNTIVSGDQKVNLTAVQLIQDPIFLDKTFDLNGQKVAYLVYNQFVNNNEAHRRLNEVFGRFKNEGISDLILDLRYNPGGSLTTTRLLASLIYGNANPNSMFGNIIYNDKLSPYFNSPLRFFESLPVVNSAGDTTSEEPIHKLEDLTRVFILTSGSTASASELLIVGLNPFMEVTTIGTTTVGKNVGSTILYDSKASLFLKNENADISDKHAYVIQPIISKLANSEGFSNYENGLEPDVIIDEKNFLNDLKPLGDVEEPLLAYVIAIIKGTGRNTNQNQIGKRFKYTDPHKMKVQKIVIDQEYIPKINK